MSNHEIPEEESTWERIRDAGIQAEQATGKREETIEEARQHLLIRMGRIIGGSVLVLVGLALMVLPGPGMVVTIMGLALLSYDVPFAARWLEKARARLPQDDDGKVSPWVLTISIISVVGSICLTIWWYFIR